MGTPTPNRIVALAEPVKPLAIAHLPLGDLATLPRVSPTMWLCWLLVHGYTVAPEDMENFGNNPHTFLNVKRQVREAGYEFEHPQVPGLYRLKVDHPHDHRPEPPSNVVRRAQKARTPKPKTERTPKPKVVVERKPKHPQLGSTLHVRMLIAADDDVIMELRDESGASWLAKIERA